MLNFYRKSLEKDVEKFVEKIKKDSKKLDKESQKFIENIFLEEKDELHYSYGVYLKSALKQELSSKKDVKFNDIFPKNIYPAIELLIGKKFLKVFLDISKNTIKYPFSRGYDRRMVRSSSYYNYINFLFELFEDLVDLNFLNLDIVTVVKGEYDNDGIYGLYNPYLIAYEIDNGNKELIDLIKAALGSQKSKIDLNYSIMQAIFISNNKELLELTGKLLLAAKLQEGVRQEICENMDRGLQENFEYMFKIIYDNNLIRFSSVKRALATWTGLASESDDISKFGKKELEIINKLIANPKYEDELLKSDDNVEVYLGLWNKSTRDIKYSIEAMEKLLKLSKYHTKLLISYYLHTIEDKQYQREIAKKVIKEYGKDNKNIVEILACYLDFAIGYIYPSHFKDDIKSGKLNPKTYFKDKKEALEFFDILENAFSLMKEKSKVFDPCIFPWNIESMDTEKISTTLLFIAILYPDDILKNKVMGYIKEIDTWNRGRFLEVLFERPSNKEQKDFIITMLSDRTSAGITAYEIAKDNNLVKEYPREIEDLLRLKNADTRKNLIDLLMSQDKKELLISIDNLVSAKNENKRLAGLDILNLANSKQKPLYDKKEVKNLVTKISSPTDAEKILIENLSDKKKKESENTLSKLYNTEYKLDLPYEIKEVEKLSKTIKKNKKSEYIIENSLNIKKIFTKSTDELFKIVKKLSELYVKNEDYEYMSFYTKEYTLLRDGFSITKDVNNVPYNERQKLSNYPLEDVWRDFYKNEIKDFSTLWQLYTLDYNSSINENNIKEYQDFYKKILGIDITELRTKLKKANLKYVFSENYYNDTGYVLEIIDMLYEEYSKENKDYLFEIGKVFTSYVLENFEAKDIVKQQERYNKEIYYNVNIYNRYSGLEYLFVKAIDYLEFYNDEKAFTESFVLRYNLDKKIEKYINENLKDCEIGGTTKAFGLRNYAIASILKIAEKDLIYKYVLELDNEVAKEINVHGFSELDGFMNNYRNILAKKEDKRIATLNQFMLNDALKVIYDEGRKIVDYVVQNELKRGDSPTIYSKSLHKIYRIEGIDYLVQILQALGKETLDRTSYYWGGDDSKKAVLSHLLKVCYPTEKDNSKELAKKLKGTDITEQRLVEVAMYASQWLEIIESYLGWKGLVSGCYYFQAHMSDVDKNKEGLIAKYTPISIDDLRDGAFDIDWFKSAYKELGEKKFEMLYDSAKYISDGAKHSRARMFADAVNGKLNLKETEKKIEDKRNKDLVASYSLIPLLKDKQKDALHRYQFLQKFLKDSKKFGAQRRASEAKAVNISLENLSRNMGYSDVTRLIWNMETALINEMKEYFEPKKLDDIDVYIKIDDLGQSEIIYEKAGKELKSLPTKLKKDKYIETIKEVHKNLKEQYRRSRKMLEEAMEDGTEFYGYEIENLMTNPVIAPILKSLVFKMGNHLGYYVDNKLKSAKKKFVAVKDDSLLKIAHCFDLFESGEWATYQKDIFDRELRQPFKQVFRELYVKTVDEKGRDKSLRYAGHQVQPAKTVALLKTRRWIIDGEEGLEKVYYKENIIAKIFALADWFSPADIEAPTLEEVQFFDRKTFKPILIDEVPDLIFTEVMRDIDLVVSVAHVGDVDPEASHSTIEMRKAIIEFNCKLFKLKNVTFTENHALIKGERAEYSIHLGSRLIHQKAGSAINVLPVHSQHRGRVFLPFIDDDPKTAEIMAKVLLFAQDDKIKDVFILEQIK
ncbi:Uncharacterised protein [Fusobacterium polymorphum]|uniref:DUF4132 domain-containing protein n=1 Tax=Fusobacterium polymorphum ATCC 10953 TaxID=393480 RepID=A5TSL6_FUSNP|nr:DUF4132 domain-containing protein [Fusobacterium polymorphum]EDK87891.1 hypothetical protein FNP_0072 [Fusobacterium polymorphum ATCC 10953]UTI53013.1 DUF5724 domain-containing protein [Fusobacterium polymorphum]WRL67526.1 DUF5724 domain-containing protein [Fusobacterium polymorphum]CKH19170.1 Uncharacterised protein [Fusobacterium polymorphum]